MLKLENFSNNNEKIKYSNTFNSILTNIANIFNDYFSYNYRELSTFFDYLEKIIFYNDEKVQKIGFECVKYLFNIDIIQNLSFLQPYIIFLTSIVNKSSGKELLKINIIDIKNDNKEDSKNLYNLINKNFFLSYIHYNTILLLDISIC